MYRLIIGLLKKVGLLVIFLEKNYFKFFAKALNLYANFLTNVCGFLFCFKNTKQNCLYIVTLTVYLKPLNRRPNG